MAKPRAVFDDPDSHWQFLTTPRDEDFEGQHFDRKEVCRAGVSGAVSHADLRRFRRDEIASTISAFANTNRDGGLLALGISSGGAVAGTAHLFEDQRNTLANVHDILTGHAATVRFHDCTNSNGRSDAICLIYVPYSERQVCETPGDQRAWERRGPQNIPVSPDRRDALRREKRILDFERLPACALDMRDIDSGVLGEFRSSALADSTLKRTDEGVLQAAGALEAEGHGQDVLTNAGALFFHANPQRVMPYATIRLLRYGVAYADRERRGLPDFDRELGGSVTGQLLAFRALVHEAGFFKTYQRRRPNGGFVDEPELPTVALDEAVVNAVAHRDYAVRLPILCEKYTDAFVVRSPGLLRQRAADVPSAFTLADVQLEHLPPNPFLMRWLREIRDSRGRPFVQALSEGTRTMQLAMAELGLPAPEFVLGDGLTTVILHSNAPAREAALRAGPAQVATSEYANLFRLTWTSSAEAALESRHAWRRELLEALRLRLLGANWYAEPGRKGRVIAHRRHDHVDAPEKVARIVRLYPAYEFHVRDYGNHSYLCVDYTAEVQPVVPVDRLLRMTIVSTSELVGARVVAQYSGSWMPGRLIEVDREFCRVHLFGPESEVTVESTKVIPKLWRHVLDRALATTGIAYDLAGEIKKVSLALQAKAARLRSERTLKLVEHLAGTVFPLTVAGATVALESGPVALIRRADADEPLSLASLPEPMVEFSRGRTQQNIREGITKFGAYTHEPRDIELIPICAIPHSERMAALIERLRAGKMRYQGAERTFSTRLTYRTIVATPTEVVTAEVERLLAQHPEWTGADGLPRLFLVHTPEHGHSLDDENSPYYRVKRLALERGVPCQMVDTPTLANPDYKDLNLTLNIIAKVGVAPWVLPNSIPDADFFVGLSYTKHARGEQERLMGFANVFNEYGRWEFYSGSGEAFRYEDREQRYERLVRETLVRLESRLNETPRVCFHYSARFSRMDRDAILRGARAVRPRGTYTFVWVNVHHPVRLYDSRPEGDGSLARGSYVVGGRGQVYLSTTGHNAYRQVLGTPHALELNAHVEAPPGSSGRAVPDLRGIAAQVLSLTKLNWASSDSLCAEPISTKYAGDIAYLTAAFMRQRGEPFRLHPVLERTPWFI
ncbi:MAG: putative DNA binding domain-containing protein [Gemmatimonadales bacterium]